MILCPAMLEDKLVLALRWLNTESAVEPQVNEETASGNDLSADGDKLYHYIVIIIFYALQ
jgi:hypothetical protein